MRWQLLAGLTFLAVLGCHQHHDSAVRVSLPPGGIVIGAKDAPVILVEFGSFDCPVCRYLHEGVFPMAVSPYVAQGDVKVRYVDLSVSDRGRKLAASLGCSLEFTPGRDVERIVRGFSFVGNDFSSAFKPALDVSSKMFRSCIADADREAQRTAERRAAEAIGVRGKPTLIIGYQKNERTTIGWPSIGVPREGRLGELIDSALTLVGGN